MGHEGHRGRALAQRVGDEAPLSLGPAGRARGLGAKARSPHTLWAGFCFSWQILITLYFDHTVECYISTSKLNLTGSLLMKKKCEMCNPSSLVCGTKPHALQVECSYLEHSLILKTKTL